MSSDDLVARFGSAKRPDRAVGRETPPGLSPDSIAALGKLSEALEAAEHARGHLYAFHRLSGTADLTLQEAVEKLRAAGHAALADEIDSVLVGRSVLADRWTYELVEDYDANYWRAFRAVEQRARECVGADVPRHLLEARMQADEQNRVGARCTT